MSEFSVCSLTEQNQILFCSGLSRSLHCTLWKLSSPHFCLLDNNNMNYTITCVIWSSDAQILRHQAGCKTILVMITGKRTLRLTLMDRRLEKWPGPCCMESPSPPSTPIFCILLKLINVTFQNSFRFLKPFFFFFYHSVAQCRFTWEIESWIWNRKFCILLL